MSLHLTKAAAAAVLAASVLAACHSDTPESLVAEAKQYQQKGDNKAAIIQLKNALEKNPDDAQARFLLASIALQTDDVLTAEKEARRALALKFPAEQALPVLGNALLLQGKLDEALAETEKGPQTADLLAVRGNALQGLGKPDEAKQAFDAALVKQPGHGEAMTGLARLAALQKDWDGALRLANDAIARDAKNVGAWQLKAELLRVQNKPEEAMAAYQQILKIKPEHRTAHLEQAALHIAAGKLDAAQADIEAARKTTPGSYLVAYHQALLDFSRGKMTDAQANLLKVMQAAPNHMPSVLLAGAVELNLGLLEQAEKDLRKYVEWNPGNVYARKMLVSTLLKSNQPREAQTILAPALQGNVVDAGWLQLAGDAAMLTQDYAKASGYLAAAIKLEPGRAATHTSLGTMKLAQGDAAGGIAELEKAVALDPASLPSGTALVEALLQTGATDKAVAAVATLEKTHAGSVELQLLKGRTLLAKQDVPNARAAFERAQTIDAASFPAAASLAQLDMADRKPDQARKRFETLLAKDGKNIEVLTALATLDKSQGRNDEATAWLEKASQQNPDDLKAALRLAMHYTASGEPQKAQTMLRKLQVAHADDAGLLDVLGQAQVASKDGAAALETFGKLVAVMPRAALPQMRLAGAQMMTNNPAAAAASMDKAVSLEPDNIQPYIGKAELAVARGDQAQALAVVRQVQKRFPKVAVGYLLEGDLLAQQGKPALAVKPYEQALAISDAPPVVIKVAKALRDAGKAAEADQRVAAYRITHPDEPLTSVYLAEIQIAQKQFPQAAKLLESVAAKAPENALVLNNLAWVYQQQKDERALSTAERVLKLNDTDPNVLDTVGWILVEQGKAERGLALLRKAAAAAPKSPDIQYHLGAALLKNGDKAGARKALETALAGPAFGDAKQAKALLEQL